MKHLKKYLFLAFIAFIPSVSFAQRTAIFNNLQLGSAFTRLAPAVQGLVGENSHGPQQFEEKLHATPFSVQGTKSADLTTIFGLFALADPNIDPNTLKFSVWYWKSPWYDSFRMKTAASQGSGAPNNVIYPDNVLACKSFSIRTNQYIGSLFGDSVFMVQCNIQPGSLIVKEGAIGLVLQPVTRSPVLSQQSFNEVAASYVLTDRGTGFGFVSPGPIGAPSFGTYEDVAPAAALMGNLK